MKMKRKSEDQKRYRSFTISWEGRSLIHYERDREYWGWDRRLIIGSKAIIVGRRRNDITIRFYVKWPMKSESDEA
jgi:hypothetical protein